MIYGKPHAVILNDTTDLIGIRTLVLSLLWQPDGGDLSMTAIDKQKPDAPAVSSQLLLVGEQTRQTEGGLRTTWTFQGACESSGGIVLRTRANSLDYGFEPGFAQVSIQRHPKFQSMLTNYGGYPDNDGQRVLWPAQISTGDNEGGLGSSSGSTTNPMFGVNEFFQMEGTYRYRYAAMSLPGGILSNAGKIASPPGEPPALVEGRNWLMLPVQYRRRGPVFDITEQYWLSGRGGWPRPVYS